MEKDELVRILKSHWKEWETFDGVARDAIELAGEDFLDIFTQMDWQEQDAVIHSLMAIRGQ